MSFCFYRLDFTNFVTLLTTPLGTCLDTFTVSSPSGATSSSASPLCGTNSNQHSEWQKFAFLKTRQFLDEKHYAKFFLKRIVRTEKNWGWLLLSIFYPCWLKGRKYNGKRLFWWMEMTIVWPFHYLMTSITSLNCNVMIKHVLVDEQTLNAVKI